MRLLAYSSAARTPAGGKAIEVWLQAALACSADVSAECLELLDVADQLDIPKLLNLAWRLLKAVCLDSRCSEVLVVKVLHRALVGMATQLTVVAGGKDDALFVATFHCGNFRRLAREAPALDMCAFPLRLVVSTFGTGRQGPSGCICTESS